MANLFRSYLLDEAVALKSIVKEKVVVRRVFERDGFDHFASQNAADDGANRRQLGERERSPRGLELLRRHADFRQVTLRQRLQRRDDHGTLQRVGKGAVVRSAIFQKKPE